MRVVSNTSPVCNLAIIGRLGLLRRKFGKVVIPEAVARELSALDHAKGRANIEEALQDGWLTVECVCDRRLLPVLRSHIDEGEAEAIELARQTHAELLILDDLDARRIAAEESLPYTGLLGLLAEERMAGNLASLEDEIRRLRSECRFFVSPALELKLLCGVGER
jgi:predicted nucleic acid-binding protein